MSFDGTWDVTVQSPMGAKTFRIEVRTADGSVSGTAAMGEDSTPLLDPALRDGHLTWAIRITRPMNITLAFDVTCEGDALAGTAKAGFMTLPEVTGVRVK